MLVCAAPATQSGCHQVPRSCVCVTVCDCVWNYCMLSLCVCEVIVSERWYVTKLCLCECVWSYCMLSLCVCERIVCSICVCEDMVCDMCGGEIMWEMVCDKVVFVWVCAKLLYVKFVCVWKDCMFNLCVWSYGMWHVWRWNYWCHAVVCVCEGVWNYSMLSLCVCVKFLYVRDGMWQSCVCVWVCVKLLYVKFVWCEEQAAGGGEGARDTESKTRTPHKVVGK